METLIFSQNNEGASKEVLNGRVLCSSEFPDLIPFGVKLRHIHCDPESTRETDGNCPLYRTMKQKFYH